jgi:uncharacterized membrane protein YraQ (UPF0718 family)
MFSFLSDVFLASWDILQQASIYMLFGLLVGGLLKMFLSPSYVAAHLGKGRFRTVFKAALLGIPIPLCSCGVLPAAAALKKQGANNGATTAFLISTPESGVDSISITWALLDPIMTVARPVAAFVSAFVAGVGENLLNPPAPDKQARADISCPIDNCCDGIDCTPEDHKNHHTLFEKCRVGIKYAATELWGDLAGWFFVGVLLAGIITVLVPDDMVSRYLGGGLSSMLLMLVFGIPLYICATASTPIAAAFILKGVSPGAALVFLLVGPATNVTSLSVLVGILGKRATALYLVSIAVVAVVFGLLVDMLYSSLGISAAAIVGKTGDVLPGWVMLTASLVLLALSIQPIFRILRSWFPGADDGCGCSSGTCSTGDDHGHSHGYDHKHDDCGDSCHTLPPLTTLQTPDSLGIGKK